MHSFKARSGLDFCKFDPDTVKAFGYLHKMKSPLGRIFFEERKSSEAMFDSVPISVSVMFK